MALTLHPSGVGQVRELASGVDALYLSGRADLDERLFEVLEGHRAAALEAGGPVPFEVGGETFLVKPHGFSKYRFCLDHPHGRVGVTASRRFPALRVQHRAEHLHAVGPRESLRFFEGVGELLAGGPVRWSLARLDLFCDVQGWALDGDDRHRFVCQSQRLDLHEDGEAFTGFEFGRRSTNTVCARIYDKTAQVKAKGIDWWGDVWGEALDAALPVLRVEFEMGRQGLREFGIDTPTEGLDQADRLWAGLSENWLSYRLPTDDGTKCRWPVAAEWEAVQQASLRSKAIGLERVRAGQRRGTLRTITPALVGYMASAGAALDLDDLDSTVGALRQLVRNDEIRRRIAFSARIAERKLRALGP